MRDIHRSSYQLVSLIITNKQYFALAPSSKRIQGRITDPITYFLRHCRLTGPGVAGIYGQLPPHTFFLHQPQPSHPMSTLTSHPAPNPPSNLRFPINSSGNLGPYRLALRIDEFRIRVVMLSKRLQRHRRSIEKLSPTELQVTLDTAVHLLLRWIPDCWILGVEYGHKSQLVFRRLLSSAFYMSRMFHYFRKLVPQYPSAPTPRDGEKILTIMKSREARLQLFV